MRLKFYLLLNFYQIIACIATVTMLSRAVTIVNTAATIRLLKLPQQINDCFNGNNTVRSTIKYIIFGDITEDIIDNGNNSLVPNTMQY